MEENGKSRKEVCEALGVSYYTFSDWVNGKKYPRMDKVEKLANYFNILKSDLIEDKQKQPTQGELSYKKREFIKRVEGMTEAQLERLEQILALVENTEQ
jgi:transcriptional regulator with XRE-family HTH domain